MTHYVIIGKPERGILFQEGKPLPHRLRTKQTIKKQRAVVCPQPA